MPPAPPTAGDAAGAHRAAGGLDARTIDLVQQSWAQVVPISDAAAILFYDRLFVLDSSLRALFKDDLQEQKKKLMQTLGVAVDGLRTPAKLIPALEALGKRHVGYMVQPHHYDLVGSALLWALREGLGDGFTAEVEAAWKRVYTFVAAAMKRGAGWSDGEEIRAKTHVDSAPASGRSSARISRPAAAHSAPGQPPARGDAAAASQRHQWPSVSRPTLATEAYTRAALLDARSINLVQRSWAQVAPISDAAATLFYDRLFTLDPSLRALFKDDLREQKKKLMQTLRVAVDGLRNPVELIPVLESLGERHVGYMVQAHHYDLVGSALLWALREGLGDAFTIEVEAAWNEVYAFVASAMKRGAGLDTNEVRVTLLSEPEEAEPAPASSGHVNRDDRPATSHERARGSGAALHAPAPAAPPGPATLDLRLPSSGTLRIQLALDPASPPLMVAPTAPAPQPAGLAMPLLLAVTCASVIVALTTVLLLEPGGIASARPGAALYLLLLAVMGVVAAAFLFGYRSGRRAAAPARAPREKPGS